MGEKDTCPGCRDTNFDALNGREFRIRQEMIKPDTDATPAPVPRSSVFSWRGILAGLWQRIQNLWPDITTRHHDGGYNTAHHDNHDHNTAHHDNGYNARDLTVNDDGFDQAQIEEAIFQNDIDEAKRRSKRDASWFAFLS